MVKAMRKSATPMKATIGKTQEWKKMSKEEIRLMTMWYKEDDKAPSEIAALLHRSKSSVTRHLFVKTAPATQGRTPKLTEAQVGPLSWHG